MKYAVCKYFEEILFGEDAKFVKVRSVYEIVKTIYLVCMLFQPTT